VADAGNGDVTSGTSFGVNLDGRSFALDPPSVTDTFVPIISSPENWIINVSGVKSLQLVLQGRLNNRPRVIPACVRGAYWRLSSGDSGRSRLSPVLTIS
jgi:hypothetical protein